MRKYTFIYSLCWTANEHVLLIVNKQPLRIINWLALVLFHIMRKALTNRKSRKSVAEIDVVEFLVEMQEKKVPRNKQGMKRVVVSIDDKDNVKGLGLRI